MRWSTRKLGTHLDVSHMMVARVRRKHGLKPHRIERDMASNDPDFETKAAGIIGLYLNPPAHAAVFCVDEKTAIHGLDRKDPVLPLSCNSNFAAASKQIPVRKIYCLDAAGLRNRLSTRR
jgi:hypothetical protein